MDNIIFAERENACLQTPALKMRQRLKSAPEKLLKSPMITKTPLPAGRKAFGDVNKKVSTPAVGVQEKKLVKPQEAKVKPAPQNKPEYPEIEKFIPYDPLEFERYTVPEDLIPLSGLALPGLASFSHCPPLIEDELDMLAPLPDFSPVKMPARSDNHCGLDAFLQTINELTVDLPPEPCID